MLNNQRTATEVWEMARERPNEVYFGQLARKYSVESQSSTLNGEIPPIQKHGGKPLLEKEAFAMKPLYSVASPVKPLVLDAAR